MQGRNFYYEKGEKRKSNCYTIQYVYKGSGSKVSWKMQMNQWI